MSRSAAAAKAFERELHDLGIDDDHEVDPAALGRRGALLAAAASAASWRGHLGPQFTTMQVAELLQVRTRQAVHDRVKRGRILALPTKTRAIWYPAFQFNEQGRPYPAVAAVLREFAVAEISPWTLASWFKTPKAILDGMTPAAWMADGRDTNLLVTAAFRTASRLAH